MSVGQGSTDSLADVAMYYYKTDLRTPALNNCSSTVNGNAIDVCNNNVSVTAGDSANYQHLVTFTLGLGVSGTLRYQPDYLSAVAGDYHDIVQGTKDWPIPVENTETAVDDLWHAAVDGHGQYFSAGDPAALAKSLRDEGEFWGVRAECADALGRIRARECFEVLASSTSIAHPKVRRAVVDALGRFRTTAAVEALKPRALRDESYMVEAEAARALGKTRQSSAYDVLIDVMDRPSWADVIAAGSIDGLASLRDDRALPHLYARTRYGHPSRVRRAAALAIPKLSTDRRAR